MWLSVFFSIVQNFQQQQQHKYRKETTPVSSHPSFHSTRKWTEKKLRSVNLITSPTAEIQTFSVLSVWFVLPLAIKGEMQWGSSSLEFKKGYLKGNMENIRKYKNLDLTNSFAHITLEDIFEFKSFLFSKSNLTWKC